MFHPRCTHECTLDKHQMKWVMQSTSFTRALWQVQDLTLDDIIRIKICLRKGDKHWIPQMKFSSTMAPEVYPYPTPSNSPYTSVTELFWGQEAILHTELAWLSCSWICFISFKGVEIIIEIGSYQSSFVSNTTNWRIANRRHAMQEGLVKTSRVVRNGERPKQVWFEPKSLERAGCE